MGLIRQPLARRLANVDVGQRQVVAIEHLGDLGGGRQRLLLGATVVDGLCTQSLNARLELVEFGKIGVLVHFSCPSRVGPNRAWGAVAWRRVYADYRLSSFATARNFGRRALASRPTINELSVTTIPARCKHCLVSGGTCWQIDFHQSVRRSSRLPTPSPEAKWPNGIIGHSRLLQQNRHKADIEVFQNVRFDPATVRMRDA